MKKTHKILSILLVIAMMLTMAPLSFVTSAAAEITLTEPTLTTDKYDINGDGTNDAVYEITDVSELYWFANLVNTKANSGGNNTANAMLMNNITVNENVIVDGALTSDTSSLNVWSAMGKTVFSSGWYGGCFDGNGKTISGLYVNETTAYRGFIGCLGEGGNIKNLTIADSYFTSTSNNLGAFTGTMVLNSAAVKPVIENCKLTGSIVSGKGYVGGIAGGASYGEVISNCHMYNSTIIGTGDNIGGIVGNAGNVNNETYIRLCSVNGGSVSGANKVGGIIGCGVELSKTKISACCNYGTSVTATTRYAGGILGEDGYCYSCFVTAEVTAPKNKGPFAGYGNHYYSAYDSDIYGEGINHISSKSFTTDEIEAGIATYFLTDTTPSNTVYVLWGQKIGEDKYPSWNPDGNQDYIVYRVDDTENGGYIYYNGDAAAEYEPNEDGIYEIADRSDWYKFAKKAKEDTAIDAVLTANIDFSGVDSDKLANYVIGVSGKAYTGTFDGDGYTVSNLPNATQPLFNIIGNGGELKDLNLSGATVTNTDTVSIAGLVCNNQGTVSNVTVTDVTVSGIYSAAIVYYNYGTVTGCTASDITVTGKTTAGGIVGVNHNGKTVENCHVLSGTVKAENADGYDGHAGGICGSSYGGTIKGCSNGADVSSEASRLETAAGIVGRPVDYNDVSVNIIECSNTGDINGSYAGGISGADLTSTHVNISLCYNEGNITGNVAGGIAADGSINATDKIINCYNAGEIKAVGTRAKAGGIVGNHSNSSIQNCHNYGKVISEYLAAPISCTDVGAWHGADELINNHAIEGNIQAPNISPYLDTAGAATNFDAVVVGSTREEFADGTVTAKLNAGNSETVWYQYTEYPILEERHVHQWSYTSVGTDTIKAECIISGCDLSNNYGGTMSIKAPADLLFNGNSKDAECIYTDWLPAKPAVVYNDVDRVNVTGQDIVASVTAGEATASVSYQIQPCEIIASMVTLSKTSVSYNGTEQSTTVTVKYNSSTTLAAGTDYEVMGTASATDIGTYTVTVVGKGNYTGTIEKTWKINKASIRPQILIVGWSYLDTSNTPTVNENPENGEVTYTYYISAGRRPVMTGTANGAETEGGVPKYAGTYYIGATIAETEHYNAATISPVAFTITPREVSNPDYEGLQETYLYDNGNEIKPAFTLKDDLGNVIPESEYTVTYSDNTDAGEATITITDNADGNYNVSATAKFTIITHRHDWVYTASGDTITATCANTDTGCTDTNGGTLKILAPADACTDGNAVVDNQLADKSTVVNVVYSTDDGSVPTEDGTYTASVTLGNATATVEFTLGHDYDYENGVLTRPIRITTTDWDDGYYTYTCKICDDYYHEAVKRADYTEFEETYNKILGYLNSPDLTDEAKAEIVGAVQDYLSANPEINENGNVRGDLIESEQAIVDGATAFAKQILAIIESNLSNCESGNHDVRKYTSDNNATCTEDGTKRGNCVVCGKEVVVTDESNLAFDHDYNYENGVLTRPTETENGYYTYTCKNDANHTTTEPVEGADYSAYDEAFGKVMAYLNSSELTDEVKAEIYTAVQSYIANNPNFDANGNLRRDLIENEQNIVNEATQVANQILAVVERNLTNCESGNHDVRNYTPNNNVTCTENGTKTGVCYVCGEEVTIDDESAPALGHDMITDEAVEPTCTETGLTEGSHCSRCDEMTTAQEEVPALGHDMITDEAVAPTCTETGLTEGSHCSRCDEMTTAQEEVSALGHDMITDEAVVPTCTETGLTEGSHCSRCDEMTTAQEEVSALGHDMITDEAVAPDCVNTGLTEGSHCSRCDEATTAQEEVPALGHDMITDEAVAPDCVNTGLTEGSHCSRCDEATTAQEEVPALGHDMITDEAVAPDCVNTGLTEGSHCSRCDEATTEQEEVPAFGHTPEDAVEENYVAPTCTENGSKDIVIYCAVCDAEISRETETIEATGHNDEDNDGYCDNCDEPLCDHACHKGGIRGFFWKIMKFFYRLINIQQYCDCGNLHYEKPIFNTKL